MRAERRSTCGQSTSLRSQLPWSKAVSTVSSLTIRGSSPLGTSFVKRPRFVKRRASVTLSLLLAALAAGVLAASVLADTPPPTTPTDTTATTTTTTPTPVQVIPDGVTLGGVAVGGMAPDDAVQAVLTAFKRP